MRLLVVRHAIAEEREEFERTGRDDRLRPLTDEGRKKMRRIARGLRRLVPEIDLLATSPLTRATQTGAVLDAVYGDLPTVEIEELDPDARPEDFVAWLRARQDSVVAVVGHEPSLSLIVSWLLARATRPLITLRKGGACLLELGDKPAAGAGTLIWALTPAQLRALAD
jgi:phosphohistidine phosphatase